LSDCFPPRRAERVIREDVERVAEQLEISPLLKRKPGQLSGGQRQRVAVGRAIVRQPRAFLFDEPLSNLDAKLRVHMRAEIAQLHRQLKTTFIYVTHDQAEAMTMADRIVVMNRGHVEQVGAPLDVYHRPRTRCARRRRCLQRRRG
jgi:multiple sugar transport system ATP-binding protein